MTLRVRAGGVMGQALPSSCGDDQPFPQAAARARDMLGP